MPGIDELISTFLGQTQQGLDAPPAPWQQELLETVNPAKVKKQNIARALAQASTAMATTPGNFLSGVSAAAATGANSYLTGKDQAEEQRMKVQQLVQMAQQKDQDRRLSLLMDAIGVTQKGIENKRAGESHNSQLARDKAYTDYYINRKTGAGAGGLTQSQILTTKRAIRNELRTLENQLNESAKTDETLNPESIQQAIEDRRMELEDYYGISLDSPDVPAGSDPDNVSQSDLWGTSPGQRQPGSVEVLTPDQYEGSIPQPRQSQGILQPPRAAIEALKKYPERRAEFDQKYGQGAAASILGK